MMLNCSARLSKYSILFVRFQESFMLISRLIDFKSTLNQVYVQDKKAFVEKRKLTGQAHILSRVNFGI